MPVTTVVARAPDAARLVTIATTDRRPCGAHVVLPPLAVRAGRSGRGEGERGAEADAATAAAAAVAAAAATTEGAAERG